MTIVKSKSAAVKRVATRPIIQRAGSALPRINRRAGKITIANVNKKPTKVVIKPTPKKTSVTTAPPKTVSPIVPVKKTKISKT